MKDRDQDGYYSLLGVGPQATPAEIKAAYQTALAAAEGPGLEFVRKAAEQAYAVLGDAAARQAYDPAWSPLGAVSGLSAEAVSREAPSQQGTSGNTVAEQPATPQRAWVGSEGDEPYNGLPVRRAPSLVVGHDKVRDPLGYYRLLGVSPDASPEAIRMAYMRRRSREQLPLEWLAAELVAYNVLSNPTLRVGYDPAYLSLGGRPSAAAVGFLARDAQGRPSPGLEFGFSPKVVAPAPKSNGCLGVFVILFVVGLALFLR